MNKNELVAEIAKKAGVSKTDAAKTVDAFVAAVSGALKKGGEVRLVGFGTFAVSKRAASVGRNPAQVPRLRLPPANSRNSVLVKP